MADDAHEDGLAEVSTRDESIEGLFDAEFTRLYEIRSYRHAAQILTSGCADDFAEIQDALKTFRLSVQDIIVGGGNESEIPKKLSRMLRPKGWYETHLSGDLIVTKTTIQPVEPAKKGDRKTVEGKEKIVRRLYFDGYKIDYLKNRIAFDIEWNSKDQTFDRDLYAFRAFSECGLISAAVLVTRSAELNPIFREIDQRTGRSRKNKDTISEKYGASTTWMGKLTYRIESGRNGSCPILAFGIRPPLIEDWESWTNENPLPEA